jgi:tetratricopeptide (TPR) repeat protein
MPRLLSAIVILISLIPSSALSQQTVKASSSPQDITILRSKLDSANQQIQLLNRLLTEQYSRDSTRLWQSLNDQRREFNDILSTATSISGSNVGNTIGFLALVFGIIGVLLVVFAGAGKFYLDNHLRTVTERYEQRFAERARVMEVSVDESRANFFLSIHQYKLASEVFEKILTLDPNNFFAHEKLGFLYLGDILGKPENAVHHNREAIRLRSNELFPYINLQIALDHANHPLPELEDAFNKVIQMVNLLKADEMTFGKAKLFFAGKLAALDPNRKQEAVRLNQEAITHFSKVTEPSRATERMRWTNQAQQNIQQLNQ